MANPHMCNDVCFDGKKLRNKQPINCFSCTKRFNPKCFNINIQIKDDDNIVFLCFKCILGAKEHFKIQNRKSMSRNSINSQSSSKNNTQTTIQSNKTVNQIPSEQINTNDLIMKNIDTQLNTILNKLNCLDENSITEAINTKFLKLESTIDNTFNLLVKADSKMNTLATSNEIKNATKNMCDSFNEKYDSLHVNSNSNSANELYTHNSLIDWSMGIDNTINTDTRRNSIIHNCSISDNILEVIKNHEKSTWESIDTLNRNLTTIGNDINNKIDSNTSKLDEIFNQEKDIQIGINNLHDMQESFLANANNHHLSTQPCIISSNENSSENFHVMEKQKDAIAHSNNKTKTSKTSKLKQKRQKPTPSGVELESTVISNLVNLNQTNNDAETLELNNSHSLNTDINRNSNEERIKQFNREFHLSKFDYKTTTNDILTYLNDKGVTDHSDIRVIALVKKNEDISSYSFISFKIETTDEIAEVILERNFWPSSCTIKDFVRRSRVSRIVSPSDFLSQIQITTQLR